MTSSFCESTTSCTCLSTTSSSSSSVAGAILHIAAYMDHVDVLKWLYEAAGNARSIREMQSPVICASPEIVRWMQEHWSHAELEYDVWKAAGRGDLKFIKWVEAQDQKSSVTYRSAIEAAAEAGRLEGMQYVLSQAPVDYLERALARAGYNGHLHVVEWMLNECDGIDLKEVLTEEMDLVENGRLHVIKWLVEQCKCFGGKLKDDWILDTMLRAAVCGNMEVLEYLTKHKPRGRKLEIREDNLCIDNVDVLKWLHDHRVAREQDILMFAAVTGDLQAVQWAHENCGDLRASTNVMDRAAGKSLEVVRFLHENRSEGCTRAAMNEAARNGHLGIVRCLH